MSWRIMKIPHTYSVVEYVDFELLLAEHAKCPYCGGKTRKFKDETKPIKKIMQKDALYKGYPYLNIDALPARYR